jgi:hypothetical protein
MSKAHSEDQSTPDILGQLEAYEQLTEQFERYGSLRENVEEERQSVQVHIYERVKAEYEEKIQAVEADLKKQRELLGEKIQDLLEKRSDLDKHCRKDKERLEEIDFRTRVGEFTEAECSEERSELEQRAQSQSNELARLDEIVARCTRSGLLEETKEEPKPDKNASEQTSPPPPQAEETAPEPDPPETAEAEAAEGFEIVEEDSAADDQDAPVVHCPPKLSSGKAKKNTRPEARLPGLQPEVSEFVTGYLIALEGSRNGERFPMISSNITLGSSPGIDIRLSDSGIANFHARILYKERKHFLENLDSMGRTFVNGVQASDVVELKDGDVIRLGDIKMQVEYASAKTADAN